MTVAIDTNLLLDIQTADPQYFEHSSNVLQRAAEEGALIIGEIVYGELASRMSVDELNAFLADLGVVYQPSSLDALSRSANAYRRYLENRTTETQCPSCGARFTVECPRCGQPVAWRQHLLPDFLVGGHAQTLASSLLTRDRGIFRQFFPNLARYD